MKDHQHHHKEMMATLRSLKKEELVTREQDLKEQLFWLSFKNKGGQADQSSNIKKTRRMLARVKTISNEMTMESKRKGESL